MSTQLQLTIKSNNQTQVIPHIDWLETSISLQNIYGEQILNKKVFLDLKQILDQDLIYISSHVLNEMLKIKTEIMLIRRAIKKMDNPIDKYLYTRKCDFTERHVYSVELEYKMLIYLYQNAFKNVERFVV